MKVEDTGMAFVGCHARRAVEPGGPPRLSPVANSSHQFQRANGQAHPETWRNLAAFWLSTFTFCLSASAQQYSIDWSRLASGGGTGTSGVYSVSGTLGQPDANDSVTNAHYSITGGFWALPNTVQTPDAPTLTIVPAAPGFATISWTPPTPGFVLQETWSLSPANWTNSVSGATNLIVVPTASPSRFYRLFKH